MRPPVRSLLAITCLTACASSGGGGKAADTAPDTGGEVLPEDADGDGFPRWNTTTDPTIADCDDSDLAVTPATERYLPAGPFWRGEDGGGDNSPLVAITISAMCMDVTEVTNTDFLVYLEARAAAGTPNHDEQGRELFCFEDEDDIYDERIIDDGGALSIEAGYEEHPVVEVWQWAAEDYCAFVGRRLPTEAEWEKGARGDTDTRLWPWSNDPDDISCERANFAMAGEQTRGAPPQPVPCVGDIMPVASYPTGASPYGLLDMMGNVAEWVSDWYQADYYALAPEVDPQGPDGGWATFPDGEGPAKIERGGNYLEGQHFGSTSARVPAPEDGHSNGLGFRCAQSLE